MQQQQQQQFGSVPPAVTEQKPFLNRFNNLEILKSKAKVPIKTSVSVYKECSSVIVPSTMPPSTPSPPSASLESASDCWKVNGFVSMSDSAIYINLFGPANLTRSFMLPFRNILSASKKVRQGDDGKKEEGSVWPPSDDLLSQCQDVSCWELHMSINPKADIKATIIDPWKKAYLLTIPGSLLS